MSRMVMGRASRCSHRWEPVGLADMQTVLRFCPPRVDDEWQGVHVVLFCVTCRQFTVAEAEYVGFPIRRLLPTSPRVEQRFVKKRTRKRSVRKVSKP